MSTREGGAGGTRERILTEAAALFARKGYGATSTREIAEAVDVRQPSLFHHFSSKAEIMRELLTRSLEKPMLVAEQLAAQDGPASQRLASYLLFDVVYILSLPFQRGGFDIDAVLEDPEFADLAAWLERLRTARRTMIADGIASGEFEDVGVDFATSAMTGIVLGVISTYSARPIEDPMALGRRVVAFALRALLADPTTLAELEELAVKWEPAL